MRIVLLALLGVIAAQAQPPCTQLTQTLYATGGARPVPMNGTITLSAGYTLQAGGFTVVQSQAPIQIAAGRLNTCQAAGSYEVDYSINPIPPLNETVQFTRYWTVPATGGPYKLSDIPAGATAPIEGQILPPPAPQTYAVGATGATGAQGPSGTGNAPYYAAVTNLTALTVTAAQHGQGVHPLPHCVNANGDIACSAVPDPSGNGTVTYNWPGGFSGGVLIYGGGTGAPGATGATGATGAPGPTGPAGNITLFGTMPTTAGNWCPQVVVTVGPLVQIGSWFLCSGGIISMATVTNAQMALATNSQMATATN